MGEFRGLRAAFIAGRNVKWHFAKQFTSFLKC